MINFYKYQGLGNHFVLMDRRNGAGENLSASEVRRVCDPNLGIGADGVLTVLAEADGTPRMYVQNADGSDAGMCGNGLRCVVRFLVDQMPTSQDLFSTKIWVGDQLYGCEYLADRSVRVMMGTVCTESNELPAQSPCGEELEFSVDGKSFAGSCHFFGNPHLSIFVAPDENPLELAQKWGPRLESHPAFPNRVNVSFSRPVFDGFETVVFERGVGITRACGSGACAVGASAVLRGYWKPDTPMLVHLPGGALTISVGSNWQVTMQGEAICVFEGRVSLPLLDHCSRDD